MKEKILSKLLDVPLWFLEKWIDLILWVDEKRRRERP